VRRRRVVWLFVICSLVTLTGGSITVLISHRFSTVGIADLIAVLDYGQLTEHGTHRDLMNVGGRRPGRRCRPRRTCGFPAPDAVRESGRQQFQRIAVAQFDRVEMAMVDTGDLGDS
jgi:hypothetical protein